MLHSRAVLIMTPLLPVPGIYRTISGAFWPIL